MSIKEIPQAFDLNHQWKLFCERARLPEDRMPPDQRREMKRAFFGACGQLIILLRDDLMEYESKYGEEAAANVLQDMLRQIEVFWEGEIANQKN